MDLLHALHLHHLISTLTRTLVLLSLKRHGIIALTGEEMNGIHGKHGDGIDSFAEQYVFLCCLPLLQTNILISDSILHTCATMPPLSALFRSLRLNHHLILQPSC